MALIVHVSFVGFSGIQASGLIVHNFVGFSVKHLDFQLFHTVSQLILEKSTTVLHTLKHARTASNDDNIQTHSPN
jgi:hypothetical protein